MQVDGDNEGADGDPLNRSGVIQVIYNWESWGQWFVANDAFYERFEIVPTASKLYSSIRKGKT